MAQKSTGFQVSITSDTLLGAVSAFAHDTMAGLDRDPMWNRDAEWAGASRWKDARICINGPARPYDATCGGDPICQWGFYEITMPCNAESFARHLFQGDRYMRCQAQLQQLLANKPASRNFALKTEWATWCLRVMRLVSMARYSTNLSNEYLPGRGQLWSRIPYQMLEETMPVGRNTQAAIDEINAAFDPRFVPKKTDPIERQIENFRLLTIVAPTTKHGALRTGRAAPIPRSAGDFNPDILVGRNFYVDLSKPFISGTDGGAPWPYMHVRDWAGQTALAAMEAWFGRTLGGGYWWSSVDPDGLPFTYMRPAGGMGAHLAPAHVYTLFWWGGADATIRLCEAWAQDIIDTSFGKQVENGIKHFLDLVAALPPELRMLSQTQMADIRDKMISSNIDMVSATIGAVGGAVGGIVAAINAAAGAFVAVAVAIMSLLVEILRAAGAYAFGGAVLEGACLTSPLVRSIKDPNQAACNFDVTPTDMQATDTANRMTAVAAMAQSGASTDLWFEASRIASEHPEDGAPPVLGPAPPPAAPPPPPETTSSAKPYLIAAGVVLGGAVLIKALKKG